MNNKAAKKLRLEALRIAMVTEHSYKDAYKELKKAKVKLKG